MTRTRRLARLDLDLRRLSDDLARSDRFRFSDAYSEFTCGSWKGSALCNGSGDLYDTRIEDYLGPYLQTEHGRQMPYVMELVEQHFHTDKMRFARLGRITPGSVMVPHRDYLELDHELVRIHVPLHTSAECFSSENDLIYQMRLGDVWYIDASQAHSAVSFFTEDRTHLILDFIADGVQDVLRFTPDTTVGVPPDATVPRAPLSEPELAALHGLSAIISPFNYRDVLALIIKQYFCSELSVPELFELASFVAKAGDQTEAYDKLEWLRTHALVARQD